MPPIAANSEAMPAETAATDRVDVMGLPVARVSETAAIRAVLQGLRARRGGWICPANLDVLRQVVAAPEIRSIVEQADLVVADGMPLVWASRLQRAPLPERVAGSSLIETLSGAAAPAGASIFLLGGDPGVAAAAGVRLAEANPGLRIAGTLCPPLGFERSAGELRRIRDALTRARPDVVFVALGFPKQERLILSLRPLLPDAWFVSCGISLSYVTGDVTRPPRWLQRLGGEWLYRLAQEPRRLGRRYLVDGLPFMGQLLASAVRHRATGAQSAR